LENDFVDLEDCQNESPTAKEFKEFAEKYKNEDLCFIGYLISPEREDYRVSITGIEAKSQDCKFIDEFIKLFSRADEFECSQGYQRCWYD
jgi:hypothetical protein